MKPVFSYIDYRHFLKEYYEDHKANTRYFSYRFFANRADIKNPVFYKLVVDGKRNLTGIMIERFCKALRLNEKEALFFRHLVLFNQAKNAREKQEHYLVMKEMAHQVRQHIVDEEMFDYYDNWYTSVIRELICQHDFRDDFNAIAAAAYPKITLRQAREAVKLLLRMGMVTKKDDGTYVQNHRAITTGPEVRSIAVRSFNKQMIELAGRAVDELPLDKRYASGTTMGVTKECYDVLVSEIVAFKDRMITIVNSYEGGDRVYQMNLQLFPVTQEPLKIKRGIGHEK